jgi:hypothetical protein
MSRMTNIVQSIVGLRIVTGDAPDLELPVKPEKRIMA